MWSASIAIALHSIFKAMAYSIKYFKPEIDKEDTLKALCYIQNINNKYVLFVNGVQSTYAPNVWSALLCEEFKTNSSLFIREDWVNLNFLSSIKSSFNCEADKLRNSLSLEQQFILDSQYAISPKSGSSFISIKVENNKINYSMLGDNFLFIYNEKTKSLLAYCSMVDKNGKLDLSQPCHCLYNDLSLLGIPITGEKPLKDSICFILSRDMANWFIDNCKSNLSQTINTLLSLSNDEDYNKLLQKIQSLQRYKGYPFDKSTSCCMIIQRDKESIGTDFIEKIKTWYHNNIIAVLCLIATVVLFISLFCILGNKGKTEKIEKKDHVKVENKSSKKVAVIPTVVDEYKYYHDLLANDNLSFKSVKEMLVKADESNLKEKNRPLYDTIYSYAHFVNRYNVIGQPRLRDALRDLFSNVPNGAYTIHRKDSNSLVLSTNLTSGEIMFFRTSHKRNIIELFIGKYNNGNKIQQYADDEKKTRYTKAINNRNIWKSFSEMN